MTDGFSDHINIGPGLRCVKLALKWYGQIYCFEDGIWQTVTRGCSSKEASRRALHGMLRRTYLEYEKTRGHG